MGKLVHFRGDGMAVEMRLDRQRITIGRRRDNDLCLPYPAVSGEHAAVVTILADSFLEDLGSTNGTLVNGATISKHFLRDRDRIDVGQQILTYVADDAAAVEPPPSTGKSRDTSRHVDTTDPTLIAPAVLRANRRSDVASPASASPTGAVDRAATAGNDRHLPVEPPAPPPAATPAPAPAATPAPALAATPAPETDRALGAPLQPWTGVEPALKVISGAKAGRLVALLKDETLIGRAGVQVVALRRGANEVRIVPLEGAFPPTVNGIHVVPEGRPLEVGDILEVAGTKIEVVAAIKRTLD